MSKEETDGTVQLSQNKPTSVPIEALYTWIIWQFPSSEDEHAFGAVRPPYNGGDWYPATIDLNKEKISIFGHLSEKFTSPEEISTYFSTEKIEATSK